MNVYRPVRTDASFDPLFDELCGDVIDAPFVDTGHWQAKRGVPMTKTHELLNVILELSIAATPGAWASWMRPNLPWAEDHFQERVSGKPWNPPPSHIYWPFNQAGNKDHMDGEVFSHTYPERLWPINAPQSTKALESDRWEVQGHKMGIRYGYGDLLHAVQLLAEEPHTRQCYIPLWYPEDLCAAAVHHQRVPCTLGYHIILRNNRLHVFYPMRSLDLLRYARDDFYMAGRLTHWFLEALKKNANDNSVWHDVQPGILTVHAVSLHVFENDVPAIRHRLEKQRKRQEAVA